MGLQVEHLVKMFGTKKAVNDLSFSIEEPGVFGLIGTNGAGKTTTIRNILGIMTPDSGSVTWNGKPVSRDSLSYGYMPEERGIYMKTKVLEQLIYFGMLKGMSKAKAKKSALYYMERLGIMEYKDMPAEKLSKGNQQKVQLAVTLIHNPRLIFLDEPFSGLDPLNANVLRELINELVNEGKYIVMSTHQMSTVEEYCRDLVILNRGTTMLSGNLMKIKAGYGHTNLIVSAKEEVNAIAAKCGLQILEKRASETEFKIDGDESAYRFLNSMLEKSIYPIKFEIKEPSLQEIFVEKVGEDK